MNSDFRFYRSIVLKRLPLVLGIVAACLVASIIYALTAPAVYRAEALLLVESPQIPGNLAESTVQNNAPEQLEIIEQRLLTRANLIDIANEYRVYEGEDFVPDEIVEEMREDSDFLRSFGRDRATLLTIAFESSSPETAALVANEYVTRVLEENVEIRTGIAVETLDFFEQEVERLSVDLDRQSARILDFKNENLDALPESLDYRMNRQSLLAERRAQLERDKIGLINQRDRLEQLFEATGRIDAGPGANVSPQQAQLNRLRDDLAAARAVYSDQNPRVKVLITQIDRLEKAIGAESSGGAEQVAPSGDPARAVLDLQLTEIDSRVAFIDEQIQLITSELSQLEDSIARTPGNTVTLEALERDYQNIRAQYDAATARLAAAATGERIELTAKGQRISVLRQAVVPREPDSPNRPRVILIGLFGGLAAGLGLVFLMEYLNRTVRRPADLSKALGITPLATVPYIPSSSEMVRRRGTAFAVVAAVAIGIPAALYYVHVEYLPLDLLADRAMSRLGL